MRIKKSTFKRILRRKLYEILDAETPADVEAVEGVWAGCTDAGNLELDIDFAKAAGAEPVTGHRDNKVKDSEVMMIVQQEVRRHFRETALHKKLIRRRGTKIKRRRMNEVRMARVHGAPMPVKSRASSALRHALRGEGIPNTLLEAMESYIERDVRSGLRESTALANLRDEVDEFILLCKKARR
jgi:hypothetical protein